MSVDVDLGVVRDVRLGKRDLDRSCKSCALGVGSCYVVSVAGVAVAGELGVDLRAARLCVLVFLENEHTCAFAHNKAVAVLVKRT